MLYPTNPDRCDPMRPDEAPRRMQPMTAQTADRLGITSRDVSTLCHARDNLRTVADAIIKSTDTPTATQKAVVSCVIRAIMEIETALA